MSTRPKSKRPLFHPEAEGDEVEWWCTDCCEVVPFDHDCLALVLERSLKKNTPALLVEVP